MGLSTPKDPPSPLDAIQPTIQTHTLENGLRVYTLEDHSAPLVAIQNWLQVGSFHESTGKGENPGTTGVSHFFEHMMFKGTSRHPHYFDEIYALGGKLNAWTWMDSTVYWEVIPSQHLPRVIQVEADRFKNMSLDFNALETEREVIKAERLLRIDNSPPGVLGEVLDATALGDHPYHWPTIGWMQDIDHLTLEIASRHRETYYVPNNLFIVIVGSFDTTLILDAIRNAYGDLPPGTLPAPIMDPSPPMALNRRDYIFRDVERPSFNLAFPVPPFGHPDWPAIEVLNQMLNGGRGSRMKQALIHGDDPLVTSVRSNLYPVRAPYLYTWSATPLHRVSNEEILREMKRVLEEICSDSIDSDEIRRAITRLQAGGIRRMLNNQEKAEMIGFGIRTTDKPEHFFQLVHAYDQVTTEEIQRIARGLFLTEHETRLTAVAPHRVATAIHECKETPASPLDASRLEEIFEWKQQHWQLLQDLRALTAEETAIAGLRQRGEDTLATAGPEEKENITSFLEHGEHGHKARESKLESKRNELDERSDKHMEQGASLLARVHEDGSDGHTPHVDFSKTEWLLDAKSGTEAPALEGDLGEGMTACIALLFCLEMDNRGLSEQAQHLRNALLAALPETPTAPPILRTIRSIVFDTQRVGHIDRNPLLGGGV